MEQQKSDAGVTKVAMNLEVHVIPVSDVERAKQLPLDSVSRRLSDDAHASIQPIVLGR